MSCSSRIGVPNYDFFDNIPTYLINVEKANKDASELNTDDNCVSFSKQHTINYTDIGKQICEQFIKLCKQLPNIKNYNITDPNYRKDWDFLSYWLNSKLRESELNGTICPKKFYDGMENHCMNTLSRFVSSTNLIYHINEDDLNRMKALYILHNNYNDKYKEYCKQLDKFKTKYEKLFITAKSKGKEFANNFKKITDYDNSNIISTTIIGSAVGLIPLLGILYKFTPMGQMFNSKKWNLSINHDNNIDEIRKTSLLDYENEQLNLKQEKYNIEYHPASIL
ncbi:PIR protein [Plasmodium vivax]|uniref:VIR protein n=1 Tax=Plasmodium vivax TaxID=5855 RepID=A0A565A667_PLAVI|nr:PIR protein [Plasmodium vivax]